MRAYDDFIRANTGPPPSASWTTARALGMKVLSNRCAPQTDSAANATCWSTACASADQEFYLKVGVAPTTINVGGMCAVVRCQAANAITGNHYECDLAWVTGGGSVEVWKLVSGTYTKIGSTYAMGRTIAVGDVFGIRVFGNNLEGLLNGVVVVSGTDSAVPTGSYVGIDYAGAVGASFSEAYGGDAVPPTESAHVFLGTS